MPDFMTEWWFLGLMIVLLLVLLGVWNYVRNKRDDDD